MQGHSLEAPRAPTPHPDSPSKHASSCSTHGPFLPYSSPMFPVLRTESLPPVGVVKFDLVLAQQQEQPEGTSMPAGGRAWKGFEGKSWCKLWGVGGRGTNLAMTNEQCKSDIVCLSRHNATSSEILHTKRIPFTLGQAALQALRQAYGLCDLLPLNCLHFYMSVGRNMMEALPVGRRLSRY